MEANKDPDSSLAKDTKQEAEAGQQASKAVDTNDTLESNNNDSKIGATQAAKKDEFEVCVWELQEEIERLVKENKVCVCHVWSLTPAATSTLQQATTKDDSNAKSMSAEGRKPANPNSKASATKNKKNEPSSDSKKTPNAKTTTTKDKATKMEKRNEMTSKNSKDAEIDPNLLCLWAFFNDSCEIYHSKIGGKCPYKPFSPPDKTLDKVIGEAKRGPLPLLVSEGAACKYFEPVRAMPMMSYTSFKLNGTCLKTSPLEYIANHLAQKDVTWSDVMYMVLDDNLMFDRCRREDCMTHHAQDIIRKKKAIALGDDFVKEACFTLLPGHLLEHVLTYLDEENILDMSLTCKSWNSALDGGSNGFWRNIMDRDEWPYPDPSQDPEVSLRQVHHRHSEAVSHAFRIGYAIDWLAVGVFECSYAYDKFADRKDTPQPSDYCSGLCIWAPRQMLAAYSYDCTLRLFECKPSADGKSQACTEIIKLTVDPWPGASINHRAMTSMDMDDKHIACLYRIADRNTRSRSDALIFIRRDEFIKCKIPGKTVKGGKGAKGGKGGKGGKKYSPSTVRIEMREAFLEYIHKNEGFEDIKPTLGRYGGIKSKKSKVSVEVSGNVCACGGGYFMMEVMVSALVHHPVLLDNTPSLIGRRLVVYSIQSKSIVWTCKYLPWKEFRYYDDRQVNISARKIGDKTVVAVVNTDENSILIGNIYPTTFKDNNRPMLTKYVADHFPEYELKNSCFHSVEVLDNCIVSCEYWLPKGEEDAEDFSFDIYKRSESTLTIYELSPGTDDEYTHRHMMMPKEYDAYRVVELLDGYVGVMCSAKLDDVDEDNNDEDEDDDDDEEEEEDDDDKSEDCSNEEDGDSDNDNNDSDDSDDDNLVDDGMEENAIYLGVGDDYDDDADEDITKIGLVVCHIESGKQIELYETFKFHESSVPGTPMVVRGNDTTCVASSYYGVAMTDENICK
jgi:F-box domain